MKFHMKVPAKKPVCARSRTTARAYPEIHNAREVDDFYI